MVKSGKVITTTCSYDCGARCLLNVHIENGKITRISSGKKAGLKIKACPKGLLQHDVAYSAERIKTPLIRTGKRGEGKFRPAGWDEAAGIVAGKIKETIKKYGSESIYFLVNTGSLSTLHNTRAATARFFGLLGKCTSFYGNVSCEAAMQSSNATFGTLFTGSTRENILHSRLIILWGWNPVVSRFGSDTTAYLAKAKKEGATIICVDPRKSKSYRALADKWICIQPGTDAALFIAMAHVMIRENIFDIKFIEKYTSGFEEFKKYVMGTGDGIAKSPEWAAGICGCGTDAVVLLARQYATTKPAALMTGWAPGRTLYGEQYHRAASVLAAMTGNIGIKGGFVSGGADFVDMGLFDKKLPAGFENHHSINKVDLYDALIKGKSANYPADCRLLYITGSNLLNQYLNLNKGIEALEKPDFTVIHELFLTPTARYADVILPVGHFFENEDIGHPWIGGPYLIAMNRIIESSPQAKSDFAIFSLIAEKLGLKDYNDRTDSQWLELLLESQEGFPGLEALNKENIYKFKYEKPHIAFKKQIDNISENPFSTPTGKIEIYSSAFAEKNDPLLPPIPKYIPAKAEAPGTEDFPLNLISPHSPARVNSMFYNIKSFKKMEDDNLWINTGDAVARGIKNGDDVIIFNKNGKVRTKAKVTSGIIPGTVSIDQGQWYRPDDTGMDTGGCINVLTQDIKSPLGAFASNTCFVQVMKAK